MKKALSVLLSMVIAFTFVCSTVTVNAEDSVSSNSKTPLIENEYSVKGTNSFGKLLSDELSTEIDEQEANNGCNVFSAEVTDKTVSVEYETIENCKLLAAIYDETGKQLLASGIVNVSSEDRMAEIEIETDNMPEFFFLRVFMIDTKTLKPMCTEYESPNYTKEMQEFFSKNVDDFDSERVYNLDNDKTNNFAVFSDDIKMIEHSDIVNTIKTADEENEYYVIENADSSVTSLKEDDIFTYTYNSGEMLIVKVGTISADGSTVTITGQDTDMEEVFKYIKIDSEKKVNKSEDSSAAANSNKNASAYLYSNTLYEKESGISIDKSDEKSVKSSLDKKIGSENNYVEVKGSISFTLKGSIKLYVSLTQAYLELKLDYNANFGIDVTGQLSHKFPIEFIGLSPVPGVYIELTPSFIVKLSAKIGFEAGISGTIGFRVGNKVKKHSLTEKPKLDGEPKVEGSFYFGFSLEPKIKVLSDNVASVSLTAETGININAKLAHDKKDDSIRHECKVCIGGNITGSFTLKANISLYSLKALLWKDEKNIDKNKNTWNFTFDLIEITDDISDFHYSRDFREFGFCSCPHYVYKTAIRVVDPNFNSVSGADVLIDGNKKGVTNENGILEIFLSSGVYNSWAIKDSNEGHDEIYIQGEPKFEVIKITKKKSNNNNDGGLDISQFIEPSKPVETKPTEPDIDTDDNFINIEKVPVLNIDDFVGRTFVSNEGDKITFLRDDSGSSNDGEVYISFYWSHNWKLLNMYLGKSFGSRTTYKSFRNVMHDGYMSAYCDYTARDRAPFHGGEFRGEYAGRNKWDFYIYYGAPDIHISTFTETTENPIVINSKIKYRISDNNEVGIVGCDSDEIKKVTIPETINGIPVTIISDHAFEYCTSLENITIPDSVTTIESGAFSHCEKLESITIPDDVTSIESYTFFYCTNLKNLTIPDSVDSIKSGAFEYCTSLENILIPNSVTSIGNYAFEECTNLKSIIIPNSVTFIGDYAFEECTSLKSIIIPDSVTSIKYRTFYNCTDLESIFIPDSVMSIGEHAFDGCSNLKDIYYSGSKEQWNKIKDIDSINADIHFNSTAPSSTSKYSSNVLRGNTYLSGEYSISNHDPEYPSDRIFESVHFKTGLIPNEIYNFYIVKPDAEYLTPDSLLYIAQETADENGILNTDPYKLYNVDHVIFLIPMSATDISDAEVTAPDILCNGKEQYVNPIVKLDDKTLEMGRDYSIQGDYSGTMPREYDINIVGKGEYKGYLKMTYDIYCKHTFSGNKCSICNSLNSVKGDVNGDIATGVADLVALERYLVKRKLTVDGNPDINYDGSINVFDAVLLRRIILRATPHNSQTKKHSYDEKRMSA